MSDGAPEPTHAEEVDFLANWSSERLSLLLCTIIQVCSQRYPEELRAALATAFDLKNYEEEAERVRRKMEGVHLFAVEVKELMRAVRKDLEGMEVQIDRIRLAADKADGHHNPRR